MGKCHPAILLLFQEPNRVSSMIKKVMLITPPYYARGISPHPQMGLAYIAGYLEKQNIEVTILDAFAEGWSESKTTGWDGKYIGLGEDEIWSRIRAFGPDFIGVHNNFTSQHRMPHLIFRIAKEIDPAIIVTTGGNHASVCPGEPLSDPNLDFVILGEGEVPTGHLIQYLNGERKFEDCDGIAFRGENREIIRRPQKVRIEDLDELPFPAWHLLNMALYWELGYAHGLRQGKRFVPIITSRGCPFSCSFCSYHCITGKKYRFRSPEHVLREIRMLKDRYEIDEITFEDDNLILNRERAEKIFDLMIHEKMNLKWEVPNGIAVTALTKQLIKKMKESGCYRINFPVESGNQVVLDSIIRKPVKLKVVPDLVDYCRSLDIDVQIFLVIGTPGENESQIWDSIRFAERMGVFNPFISICMPLIGSEAYEKCVANGYFEEGFTLDSLSLERPCFSTPVLSADRLLALKQESQRYLLRKQLMRNPFSTGNWLSLIGCYLSNNLKNRLYNLRRKIRSPPP